MSSLWPHLGRRRRNLTISALAGRRSIGIEPLTGVLFPFVTIAQPQYLIGAAQRACGPFWLLLDIAFQDAVCCYGHGYILGPSPVPPIYLTGSFGPVPPSWINYTRSAVPQIVEGHTRPDAHFVVPRAHVARAKGVDVVLFGEATAV